MSVLFLGALMQILGPVLLGLALLLVAALLSGWFSGRRRAQILERNPLLARRLESIGRVLAAWIGPPGSSRAPPTRPPAGSLQTVPVRTRAIRRRRSQSPNDL